MTNPTSNFGWQMPTPTDLVTDLPADFEVFGQAVDTSMADLKGGTTGQILSKATNTDMDFTWITNDVGDITNIAVTSPITGGGSSGSVTIGVSAASTSASGVVQLSDSTSTTSSVLASTPTATKSAYDLAAAAVPKSTVTTAGDVIYATGSAAVTRLGIGTAGQVLKVNSGATAPEWGSSTSGLTFITRQTFSNVANTGTTFDGVFTSSYFNYLIQIESLSAATGTDDLHLQLRYAGPTTQAANYWGSSWGTPSGGTAGTNTGMSNEAQWTLSLVTGDSTNVGAGLINVWHVGNGSDRPSITGNYAQIANGTSAQNVFGGQLDNARTYTGFLFKSSSSNISGTISVYGLAKA